MKREETKKARREAGRAVMRERIRKQAGRTVKSSREIEKEKARKAAEREKARREAEKEKARKEAEKERARKEAEREKARKEAEKERARKEAEREKARKEAEKERARREAEKEKARKEAEKDRLRRAAEREKARRPRRETGTWRWSRRGLVREERPRSAVEAVRERIASSRADEGGRQGMYAVWMDRIGNGKKEAPKEETVREVPWGVVLGAAYGYLGTLCLLQGIEKGKRARLFEGAAFLTLSGAYLLKDHAERVEEEDD